MQAFLLVKIVVMSKTTHWEGIFNPFFKTGSAMFAHHEILERALPYSVSSGHAVLAWALGISRNFLLPLG